LLRARNQSVVYVIALVAVAGGFAGCGTNTSGSAPPGRTDLESIFEPKGPLFTDPTGTLALMRRLGVDRVKVYVPWNQIAPDPTSRLQPSFNAAQPAAYPAANWTIWDTIVRDAHTYGVALDMTVGPSPPLWAAGPGPPPGGPFAQWRPSARDFGAFIQAIGTRYDGSYAPAGATTPLPGVHFWSIWNEPNYGPNLAPQATHHSTIEVSPRLYRGLIDAAWNALHSSGHGGDTILIGETAPRGLTFGNNPGNFSGMVPLRFLRALYCVDSAFRPLRGVAATQRGCPATAGRSRRFPHLHPALFQASGFAAHLYPQGGLAPNFKIPDEPDYADLASLSQLELTLDRSQEAYDSHRRLPIYSTEFGYQTNPPERISKTVDPVTAAYYLNWSEYISWRDPRVRSYAQYLLFDPPAASALGGFATGLKFKDGVPKPALAAFRMPLYLPITSAARGHAVEVWGCVRPAHYAQQQTGRPQRVEIQFAADSQPFKTVRTVLLSDPHGYFDVQVPFRQSGTVRLSWSYPRGATVHSRSVALTVH
jgi:hypothetical protein